MDDIAKWLQSGKDYEKGVALLAKYHKNRIFVQFFQRANPKHTLPKLEYELRKLLKGQPLTITKPASPKAASPFINKPLSKNAPAKKDVPDTIRKAKDEIYDLFTQISTMHRQLYELGESNSEQVVAQRKAILDERLPLIARYEKMYLLKEKYFDTGKLDPELIRMVEEKVRNASTEKTEKADTSALSSLSDIELLKKQHSIKVNINKTQNRLLYQALKKMDEPNPMPDCPLRTKLEGRLSELRRQYAIVTQLLESRQ